MSNLFSSVTIPGVVFFIVAALTSFSDGFYPGLGVDQPGSLMILNRISLIWALGWWMLSDSRLRRFSLIYDIGFFLLLVWPLLVSYYLFKTRGVKAFIVIGVFVLVYFGAFVVGVISGVFLA